MHSTHIEARIYEYFHPVKEYSIILSATLNKITEITNQYFADNNIYIKRPYLMIPKE